MSIKGLEASHAVVTYPDWFFLHLWAETGLAQIEKAVWAQDESNSRCLHNKLNDHCCYNYNLMCTVGNWQNFKK